ncbi:fasciclin domain-containing protein [Mucilaginibacter paludis]|uniref:Beta-Ig-H3/fasciclin n=1 Tax=Mucilaginibacter paludis DSM 18603 TaxID=714943 RepID=H1YBN3_9SPHI|nr:fasciclin domain-containing protein [Mucilaginibacter paludis]EHQ25996.1 beta-Ig-H3/fasciclin [Mucilaginibacter paludis DSM 18603]
MKPIKLPTIITSGLLSFCLLLLFLPACRKAEFMPVPEGQAVPYQNINLTLKDALAASPYTLFKTAWKRSDMDSILKAQGNKVPFTLLVPTDAAFTADGLTLDVINKTSPALLDSILLYHTINTNISTQDIKDRKENLKCRTLLQNPYLTVNPAVYGATVKDPYYYLQYLKLTDGVLFINGKTAGQSSPVQAKDGSIWPIDHVLHKPTKTILQALQDDGRFGMYLALNQRNDSLYTVVSEGIIFRDFTQGLAPDYTNNIAIYTSVFAIPDAVFHAAGYQTVDDVMNLNNRNPLPTVDYNTYTVIGGLATDTLIAYHRWGVMFAYYDPNYGGGQQVSNNFYSNDLSNTVLSGYTLVNSGYSGTYPPYLMPFDFGKSNGAITVAVAGSSHPAAKIVESDINTLMGPIHVVDHFIVPKDFKF